MAVQIQLDQAGKPPGVPGQAREDFALSTAVQATAVGGPYNAYLWMLTFKPYNVVLNLRSTALLSAADQPITLLSPITIQGTYRLALAVDSGDGLGANPEDNAAITFYAGTTLGTGGDQTPRRVPATGETTEHNAPDVLDPLGNKDGWAKERARWDAVVSRIDSNLNAGVRPDATTKYARGSQRFVIPLLADLQTTVDTTNTDQRGVMLINPPSDFYAGDAGYTRTITLNMYASTPNANGYKLTLYNLTDSAIVTTLTGVATTPTLHSTTLTVPGNLPASAKAYATRIALVNNSAGLVAVSFWSAWIDVKFT